MTKQEEVMYQIVRDIITGVKRTGESLLRRDYDLNSKQMTAVFQEFAYNGIIERPFNSAYIVAEKAIVNAQEFCLNEIAQRLNDIEDIAYSGDISDDMLIEFIRLHISDRKRRGKIR